MNKQDLSRHGFKELAQIKWQGREMVIILVDPEIARMTNALYAFVVGEQVARIGRFKGKVLGRVRHRARIVTKYFSGSGIGRGDSFTAREAECWRSCMDAEAERLQKARAVDPTIVGSVLVVSGRIDVGERVAQDAYDAERMLFEEYGKPPCNMVLR
jgi:hypothetical protein